MAIIKTVDENYNDIYKSLTPKMDEEINLYKGAFSSQRDTVNQNYGSLISDTNTEYYDEENRNAIQKIVNEQKIARKMENLGLTDSGLNRTQQTAVQLSYSNNQAKLERQRQKAVDALNLEMQGKLSEIDINESNTVAGIKDKYHQAALSAAQEKYNTEVKAETERIQAEIDAATAITKAQIEAASKGGSKLLLKFTGQQKVDDNGNVINYYSDSNGKIRYVELGKNPYTYTFNPDVLDKNGKYDASKAFKNTNYQPNNIGGVKLSAVKDKNDYAKIEVVEGHPQKVWRKGNTDQYYYWDGSKNKYIQLTESELKEIGIK